MLQIRINLNANFDQAALKIIKKYLRRNGLINREYHACILFMLIKRDKNTQ